MNGDMNFYKVYAIFLNLSILNVWNSRTSYDLKQFLKDFK